METHTLSRVHGKGNTSFMIHSEPSKSSPQWPTDSREHLNTANREENPNSMLLI